jgi:hypothetical protein
MGLTGQGCPRWRCSIMGNLQRWHGQGVEGTDSWVEEVLGVGADLVVVEMGPDPARVTQSTWRHSWRLGGYRRRQWGSSKALLGTTPA